MAFAVAWNVNPVESSVMPRFLHDHPLGIAGLWILLVTCMPVFILTMMLVRDGNFAWVPSWIPLWNITLFLLQGIVYFLIGKAVSLCVRRLKRNKTS
jgi:hypothetical protein